MTAPLLSLRSVSKEFRVGGRRILAVDGISFDIAQGECLAVVGESGSGKSTVANLILGVYPPAAGELHFRGEPLPARRELRHRRLVQLVQQNPLSSLNPRRTIGASLRLALDVHDIGRREERPGAVRELLTEVGLPSEFSGRYPAALSGGERQRVAIARALACRSELVVLDEPTSALDVPRPGSGAEAPRRASTPARAHLCLHHPRPLGRAQHRGSGRRVRAGAAGRDRGDRGPLFGAGEPVHPAPHQRRARDHPRGGAAPGAVGGHGLRR